METEVQRGHAICLASHSQQVGELGNKSRISPRAHRPRLSEGQLGADCEPKPNFNSDESGRGKSTGHGVSSSSVALIGSFLLSLGLSFLKLQKRVQRTFSGSPTPNELLTFVFKEYLALN